MNAERGISARSLARELSAVKNFIAWVADREGIDATAVLSARGPKFRRKLPRPLSVDGARDMHRSGGRCKPAKTGSPPAISPC